MTEQPVRTLAARLVRFALLLGLACLISTAATLGVSWFWTAIGGGNLTVHGWIALTLGVFGSVGLSWGLMGLAFRSHREGWDDRVDNSLDPGKDVSKDRD